MQTFGSQVDGACTQEIACSAVSQGVVLGNYIRSLRGSVGLFVGYSQPLLTIHLSLSSNTCMLPQDEIRPSLLQPTSPFSLLSPIRLWHYCMRLEWEYVGTFGAYVASASVQFFRSLSNVFIGLLPGLAIIKQTPVGLTTTEEKCTILLLAIGD